MSKSSNSDVTPIVLYDRWLLIIIATLLAFGLLMVASTSIVISEHQYGQSFHFFPHQLFYLILGIATGIIVVQIKTSYWQQINLALLILTVGLLFLVLLPGIGRQVNGSMRWLDDCLSGVLFSAPRKTSTKSNSWFS